jgi:glycosyltransferase involved in cell wall biosynthesis
MLENDSKNDKSKRICFIALGAYPLLSKTYSENVTGPNIHQFLLAKELMKHDFKITFITYKDKDRPVIETIDGIEIIKISDKKCCFNILNIIIKIYHIYNAMFKANAQIYFHAGGVAGPISIFCRSIGKQSIYSIASDALVNRRIVTRKIREFNQSKFGLEYLGNWLEIKLANAIIIQSEYQKKMLMKNYGKNGTLIKMPFPITKERMPEKTNPPIILWVGSMAEVKQPELFLKLAESVPEAGFQMIGGSGNLDFYEGIRDSAEKISNLEFFGVVPFNEIDRYFRRASILVNTSMFEGFPNAFIQAWMNYVPVVSLNADPDELICNNKLGFHSKTFDQMVNDLRIVLNNEEKREELGRNAREYVEREHNITLLINKYIEIFGINFIQ